MIEILGHDIDGRPLRAGDRAETTEPTRAGPFEAGTRVTISGHAVVPENLSKGHNIAVLVDGSPNPRLGWSCESSKLRRIDDRPDLSTWGDVAKQIGWSPSRVREGV